MEKYTNEFGKECWKGVTEDCEFTEDLFHEVENNPYEQEDYQRAFHSNLGSITVLNRLTGFGWRDVETGFRDMEGKFWLVSGGFDVILSLAGVATVGEAIQWIKENSNTCRGD